MSGTIFVSVYGAELNFCRDILTLLPLSLFSVSWFLERIIGTEPIVVSTVELFVVLWYGD